VLARRSLCEWSYNSEGSATLLMCVIVVHGLRAALSPDDHLDVNRAQRSSGSRVSLHHFESEVGGARCLDRTRPPQFEPLRIEILEAGHRRRAEGRPDGSASGPATRPSGTPSRCFLRPRCRRSCHLRRHGPARVRPRPIRHEGVGRTALHWQRLSRFVSHDEHRHPVGRRVTPRLETDIEHPLPDHDRPGRSKELVHDRGVGLRLGIELPVGESTGVVSLQRGSDACFGIGDETIEDIEMWDVTLLIAPSYRISR
jgi:hypothetical protein